MRKILSAVILLSFISTILYSCGMFQAYEIADISENAETSEVTTESAIEETTESATEITENEPTLQECHKTINNSKKPEVIRFAFSGECTGNIKKYASVSDIYDTNYLHNGVVGLVGVPFELTYGEEVSMPSISFTYDKDELRGIPEKNLIVLHYDEDEYFYNTIDSVLDTDNCTVSAEIKEQGVYLLADAYQWYECWGIDVSEYAYEKNPSEYITDWERENDTGDIMKLADKEWAMENAPEFHVSTPEQLASVVWYVNGIDSKISLIIEDDIDLSDYMWKSMGWTDATSMAFSGVVDGQNHTIKGLTIKENYCDTGFIGYGLGVSMWDINFTDARVSATGCVGIAGGEIYYPGVFENVSVSGTVKGGNDDYAAIIGREGDITFKECSADVTVNGEPFEYLSYKYKRIADAGDVIAFHIEMNEDMVVTRDEPDGDYLNLCWNVYRDSEKLEYTGASKSLDVYNKLFRKGDYKIYLTAYINGAYIPVSNTIEYHSEGYEFRWSE
ncbi:MAG: hypothetical protein K2N27_08735 [Ruminococcus sp.]|nr:hypothetical protein [Ruminococcus sp.]